MIGRTRVSERLRSYIFENTRILGSNITNIECNRLPANSILVNQMAFQQLSLPCWARIEHSIIFSFSLTACKKEVFKSDSAATQFSWISPRWYLFRSHRQCHDIRRIEGFGLMTWVMCSDKGGLQCKTFPCCSFVILVLLLAWRFPFHQCFAVITALKHFYEGPKNDLSEGNEKTANQPDVNHFCIRRWGQLLYFACEYGRHHQHDCEVDR